MSNDRLKEIDRYVDSIIKGDTIDIIRKPYKIELENYTHIKTVEEFSTLFLGNPIKYINKYDKKLRAGGLLIKVFDNKGVWTAMIKQSKKRYDVSFKSNYIFYMKHRDDAFNNILNFFIKDVDRGMYDIE